MKFLFRHNIFIILAVFIIMASFGAQLGISQMATGAEAPCPFMGEAMSICPMSVIDHIGSWKQIFFARPAAELLALIMAVIIIISFGWKILADNAATRLAYWCRYYKKKRYLSKLYNYLAQLFSQGILNPKIYTL